MQRQSYEVHTKQPKGSAMLIAVLFFVLVSATIVGFMVKPTVKTYQNSSDTIKSRQAYFAAESGIEDVLYRLKNSLPVSNSETISLGSTSATTSISDLSSSQKSISTDGVFGYVERTIGATVQTGTGTSFNYGVHVGQGGLDLQSSTVNGNVYANGPITGDSSSTISGTAISANSPSTASDQSNGTGTPAYDVTFGNATSTQDIAQSFQISSANNPINKVSLYIKKVGSPSNATVRIVTDSGGSPSTSTVVSGTLSASSVSTSYGWVDVSFSSNPALSTGTTYWLVVDASSSSSKYYIIGANASGYANGVGNIGQYSGTWNSTTPSGLDYFFNIYLGGQYGSIAGSSGSQWNRLNVTGDAKANTVNYTAASGTIYCQSGTGNNKSCNTSQTDPVYESFPISDANISSWKDEASAGGTYSGNYSVGSSGATLGPKKINGNLSVSGGGTLTVSGTLWVTGNVSLSGGGKIQLASSYGTNDGVIISDGSVSISGGASATGSGSSGSYLMLLTTDTSSSAASISGGSGALILYVPYGTLKVSGGAALKEATAYRVELQGNSTLTYESGLANNNFTSGSSGSWNISSWGETQ